MLRGIFFWKIHKCHEKNGSWVFNGFIFSYHLHSCGFKLKGQHRYLRDTFMKLMSWFRTPVVYKHFPAYSQLTGDSYLYLKVIYIRTNSYLGFSKFHIFGSFFVPKNIKNGLSLARNWLLCKMISFWRLMSITANM